MKMNCVQENYILAKTPWKAVHEIQLEKYNDFLELKGITEDSVTDENFNALSAEYEIFAKAEIENTALAYENLKLAEKALIDFGISITPASIRETLVKGINWYYNNKVELIDMLLKLDISTLSKSLRKAV
jgi:hypothetical protein